MRVLVATQHLSIVGGVETYLRAVLPRLRDRGVTLGLLTANPEQCGTSIRELVPEVPHWVASEVDATLAAATAFRPDVVYTHDLPVPAADDALAGRHPTVRYVHNYAGLCVSGTKCHSAGGWRACDRPLGPGCLAAYFPKGCGGKNPITAGRLYLSNRARQRATRRCRAVLVASEHMKGEVVRNGSPAEAVRVVPLFPPDVVPDESAPAERAMTNRVLFVGRLTPLKGLKELISAVGMAAAELGRKLTLAVVGDGLERTTCEADAARRGVSCEWHGWLGRDGVVSQMRTADVLAVPSVWPEPFGLVGIEGGCVGLPSVAFATGGISDWLTSGVSGESAPGFRPRTDEFATALVRALSDPSHHQRLRVGAWESAKRFTRTAHVTRLAQVFETLTG